MHYSSHIYRRNLILSEANLNWQNQDTYIGRSSSTQQRRLGPQPVRRRLVMEPTLRSPGLPLPLSMSGRRTQELREPSLNLEEDPWTEVNLKIGTLSSSVQSQDNWSQFRQTFSFVVTAQLKESVLTIVDLLQWREWFLCTGEPPELVNLEGPGQRRAWRLILKVNISNDDLFQIQTANSGMVTVARNILSLMNFVAQLGSPICSDGWTDIRYLLKLKAAHAYLQQRSCGSLPISILESGTQMWIPLPEMPSSEDSQASPTFRLASQYNRDLDE